MTQKRNSKIIAVHFLRDDDKYNTSAKRLAFIRKLGANPIKRQHATPNFIKYRTANRNDDKGHFTKKIDGVNVIFENL